MGSSNHLPGLPWNMFCEVSTTFIAALIVSVPESINFLLSGKENEQIGGA